MAGKPGAFGDALSNMRAASNSGDTKEPKQPSRPRPEVQTSEKLEPHSEVNRLRERKSSTRTEPFNQRIDVDVQNVLYDFARKYDWTMNRTLREAARALAVAQGDNEGAGL